MEDGSYQWLVDLAAMMDQRKHKRRFFDRRTNRWGYGDRNGPITPELIAEHIEGGDDCLAGLMLPDGEKTRFLVFDFDDHEGKTPSGIISGRVASVCDVLRHDDIPFFVVRSGGGHGYHVWIVFETAKRSDAARDLGQQVLDEAPKSSVWQDETYEGRGSVRSLMREGRELLKVELLPKGRGEHAVALPLARNGYLCAVKVGDRRYCYVHEKHPDPASFQFETYKGRKRGPQTAAARADVDAAFDALAAKYDPSDYDDWVAFTMRLIAAFGIDSSWAEERWWNWSEPASKGPEDRKKWRQCQNTRLSPITFWFDAREVGYSGKIPYKATEERKLTTLALLNDVRLLRDEIGEPFAQLGPRRFVHIRSQEFRQEMWRRYYGQEGQVPETRDVDAMIEAAGAFAAQEARERIHLRFAACGDKRYLFLADDECTVIEIDAAGWRIGDEPPVIFRNGDGLPLPMPVEGELGELLGFFNVDRENIAFLLAWAMNALYFPGEQSPILLLDGPAGAGKSSALSTIVRLLDPKVGAEAGPPKSEDDLFVAAYNGAIVSFDNVSSLAKLSDALCRLSTHGGLRKRRLYSDFDVAAMDAKRPIIIAGIDPTMYAQDLLERIVRVELHKPSQYMDDAQYQARLEQQRARLIGALLGLLSRVMSGISSAPVGRSRFGTFSRLGECVAQELGFDQGWFADEYRRRFEEMSAESAAADAVVTFIARMVANRDSGQTRRETTAGQLWEEMEDEVRSGQIIVPSSDVPPNARAMSTRISRATEVLEREHGVRVSRGKKRTFVFEWSEGSVEELEAMMKARESPF